MGGTDKGKGGRMAKMTSKRQAAKAGGRQAAARMFDSWARQGRMRVLPGVALNARPAMFDAVVKLVRKRRERPSAVVRELIDLGLATLRENPGALDALRRAGEENH